MLHYSIMQPIALQMRRDTDARWTSTGTILRPGEQSYATDTNILKIGDGINTWTNLPPIGASSTSPLLTDNFMVAGGLGILEYSYDGLTWVTSSTNIFNHDTYAGRCNSIAWNGSTWLAVGSDFAGGITNGLIASSPDGITWTADLSGGSTIFTGGEVKTVAWNGSLWVAGGNNGINGVIATSADGKTWTAQTCPFSVSCNTVASNGNIWVAGGDTGSAVIGGNQSLAYSYDGVTWVTPPTASYEYKIQSVAWNGLIWVAVGLGQLNTMFIASSSDGINWTQCPPGSAFNAGLYSVAWNGSLWMAVGDDGSTMYAATSTNGTTWTDITSNFGVTSPFIYCRSVSWNGAIWLVIGTDTAYGFSLSLTSRDTINWTPVAMGPINYISSAAASRRLLPYIGEPSVGPTTPTLSLSYYLANNTGANTGPNAISVIGFNTPDPANSVTGGALDMNYDMSSGVLTNTSSKTISVLVSGQVTTDNTAFDLTRVQPCLYVTKNSDNIVSSSVLNFNGSAFSTIVILAPNETITIRYSQTMPYDPISDVSGVQFLGGQFSTRITFTQMELEQGPSSGKGANYFSGIVRSSLIPDRPSVYDLGSTGFPFHSLHVTGATIYIGQAAIKETGGIIQLVSSDGNISTGFIGPTGPAGAISPTGTSIIYGAGSPDPISVGNLGDTYIRNDNAFIYNKEIYTVSSQWEENTTVTSKNWISMASSANGQYVAAVVGDNNVYTNDNYGEGAWTQNNIDGPQSITSIASDSTGQYLAICDNTIVSNSSIYTNNNYGSANDWVEQSAAGSAPWTSITSSSDGTTLTAVSSDGIIATSTDTGTTWNITRTNFSATCAAITYITDTSETTRVMSSVGHIYIKYGTDGQWARISPTEPVPLPTYRTVKVANVPSSNKALVIATLDYANPIKWTNDDGITWNDISENHIWSSVAVGGENTDIIFATFSDYPGGMIYSTTGAGGTFNTIQNPFDSGDWAGVWSSISCNTDGTYVAAADQGNRVYIFKRPDLTSPKAIAFEKTATWTCVAIAPDYDDTTNMTLLATAIDVSGGIYVSTNGSTLTKVITSSTSNTFQSVTICGILNVYGAAAVGTNDYVYVSVDGNAATWTPLTDFGKHDFVSVASYGSTVAIAGYIDMKLVATDASGNVWNISYSGYTPNPGPVWTWNISSPTPSFSSVTSNPSGTWAAATDSGNNLTNNNGYLWLSNDTGVTWSPINYISNTLQSWASITYEPESEIFWAAVNGGPLFTIDSGLTTCSTDYNPPDITNWTSINSCTTSGTTIVATENEGYIWVYNGSTWLSQNTPGIGNWRCATLSSDGTRIIVGASQPSSPGPIWRFVPPHPMAIWTLELDIGAIATYNPIDPTIWNNAPTTIQEAIDRMAAAYYNKYSGGVPVIV